MVFYHPNIFYFNIPNIIFKESSLELKKVDKIHLLNCHLLNKILMLKTFTIIDFNKDIKLKKY